MKVTFGKMPRIDPFFGPDDGADILSPAGDVLGQIERTTVMKDVGARTFVPSYKTVGYEVVLYDLKQNAELRIKCSTLAQARAAARGYFAPFSELSAREHFAAR
jgi:hypothetical protein